MDPLLITEIVELMWADQGSNLGPPNYQFGALPLSHRPVIDNLGYIRLRSLLSDKCSTAELRARNTNILYIAD